MAFQGDSIYWVEVEKIVPNPFQPRREFDEQKLKELSDSVRMYGILQPLTVTRKEIQRDDGTFYTEYELIAGERRLRASKLAGLAQVPVIIREGEESEQEKLELAIIENLQREDLNAVDRALAFRQLADVFGLSHVQVARKVGRSREYVSNSIRLLGLPDYMLTALKQAEISEGHARTLLMLNDKPEEQDVVFREILLKKISVRETESIVRKLAMEKVRKKTLPDFDTQLIEIEKRFMETLGTRVQIQKTEYGGRLTIDYFNVDDLEEMLKRMRAGEPLSNISYTGASLAAATPLTNIQALDYLQDSVGEDVSLSLPTPALTPDEFGSEEVENDNPVLTADPYSGVINPPPEKTEMSVDNGLVNSIQPYISSPVPVVVTDLVKEKSISNLQTYVGGHDDQPAIPIQIPTELPKIESIDMPQNDVPLAQAESKPTEDDSDLYSIRNFNI